MCALHERWWEVRFILRRMSLGDKIPMCVDLKFSLLAFMSGLATRYSQGEVHK